jgi:MoaA/NifB/PqqE/SkfB family radical SAM enzyme
MHIELTTRCTLACPGCPRTIIGNQIGVYPKIDLNIDHFAKFLDCDSGRRLSNLHIEGNHGDPIYHPHLVDFVKTFRSKKFTIVTNGSFRDKKFWESLAEGLTSDDWIIFSIDGLEHNNHLYRRNSDWKSIMLGVDIISQSVANLGWKTIIFDYNYNEIDQIQKFAESRGANFVSQTTSRFGDESLRPPTQIVDVTREYNEDTNQVWDLTPQCQLHAKEYVSADG